MSTHTTVVFCEAGMGPAGLFPPNHFLVAEKIDLWIPFLDVSCSTRDYWKNEHQSCIQAVVITIIITVAFHFMSLLLTKWYTYVIPFLLIGTFYSNSYYTSSNNQCEYALRNIKWPTWSFKIFICRSAHGIRALTTNSCMNIRSRSWSDVVRQHPCIRNLVRSASADNCMDVVWLLCDKPDKSDFRSNQWQFTSIYKL